MHGVELKKSEARYFITRVFKNAVEAYPDFNPDIHCVGAAIAWPVILAENIHITDVERLGTEAESPVVALTSPKRKRNEATWQRTIKKRKTNAGDPHEWVKKRGKSKGKVEIIKEKVMRPGCGEKCGMKCEDEFTEEARDKIYKAYYAIPSANEKRAYIISRVKRVQTTWKRRQSEDSTKTRRWTYEYSFPDPRA